MTNLANSRAVPTLNDIVHVRGRRWVVTEVIPNTLPRDIVADDGANSATVVRLLSLGEDSGTVRISPVDPPLDIR